MSRVLKQRERSRLIGEGIGELAMEELVSE